MNKISKNFYTFSLLLLAFARVIIMLKNVYYKFRFCSNYSVLLAREKKLNGRAREIDRVSTVHYTNADVFDMCMMFFLPLNFI